jgi:hypothetical protein
VFFIVYLIFKICKMKELKSKVLSRVSTGAPFNGANGLLYSFNVTFEDGNAGLYKSNQETPKHFNVGETCEYTLDEKVSGSGKPYFIVKPKTAPFVPKSGYTPKPNNILALEHARKLFNSRKEEEGKKPWTITEMLGIASFINGKFKDGIHKDAIECACTIACASFVQGKEKPSKEMAEDMDKINQWINSTNA